MCRINQTNKMENMIIHSQWRLDIIKLRVSAHSYVISTFPWFHQLFQNIFHGEDHFYPDKVSTILSVNFSLKTLDTPWSKMSPTHQFMCLWSSFGININEYIHWKPNIYKVAPWTYQNNKIPPTKMIPEGETMDLRLLSSTKTIHQFAPTWPINPIMWVILIILAEPITIPFQFKTTLRHSNISKIGGYEVIISCILFHSKSWVPNYTRIYRDQETNQIQFFRSSGIIIYPTLIIKVEVSYYKHINNMVLSDNMLKYIKRRAHHYRFKITTQHIPIQYP